MGSTHSEGYHVTTSSSFTAAHVVSATSVVDGELAKVQIFSGCTNSLKILLAMEPIACVEAKWLCIRNNTKR